MHGELDRAVAYVGRSRVKYGLPEGWRPEGEKGRCLRGDLARLPASEYRLATMGMPLHDVVVYFGERATNAALDALREEMDKMRQQLLSMN